ncbi:MAG: hypothetical protein AAB269_03580, partial [Bacteroidota bacterium]
KALLAGSLSVMSYLLSQKRRRAHNLRRLDVLDPNERSGNLYPSLTSRLASSEGVMSRPVFVILTDASFLT